MIYTVYAEADDMTFIMKSEKIEGTIDEATLEVVGYYWGKPNDESTRDMTGKLKGIYYEEPSEEKKLDRVIYYDDGLNNNKYIKRDEYKGWGIYEMKCPSGYYVHQEWLISDGKIKVVIQSYNNYCKEELLNIIDWYIEDGKMGIKAFCKGDFYIVHQSGNIEI